VPRKRWKASVVVEERRKWEAGNFLKPLAFFAPEMAQAPGGENSVGTLAQVRASANYSFNVHREPPQLLKVRIRENGFATGA
jgi:hypothetical protein